MLRKHFDFSTVFSKGVLQTGIGKELPRRRVHLETQADGLQVFLGAFFPEPFCCLALSHCRQLGSNMKSGNRLLDWLHELGKLANGLAAVQSSPTRKNKFKRFLRSLVVCGIPYSCSHRVDFSSWLLRTRPILARIHWRQGGTSALVVRTVSKFRSVFRGRIRSAHKMSNTLCRLHTL